MAFFENVGKKITDAGQGMAQSTKNFTEVNRLNSAVAEREKEVTRLYAALGQLYYEQHSRDPKAEGASFIGSINTLKEEIEVCEKEIRRIKGIGKCPSCGADLPQDAAFCNACGAAVPKQAEEEETPAAPQRLCPTCGKAVSEGNKFCNFCGAQLS